MNIDQIPAGKNFPEDIYIVIEIPSHSNPVKYEMDKDIGTMFVDRFIYPSMFYPCNYGFVNKTLSLDGDPIDALVPTPYPLFPCSVVFCRPVGILKMLDESGEDFKLIAVPHEKLTTEYQYIKDIDDISELLREQIIYFFKHYKSLEVNKWVKVIGWGGVAEAKREMTIAFNRAIK